MNGIDIDIVTVFHNETNHAQTRELLEGLREHEDEGGFRFIAVDNRVRNRGFAAGCNLGAFHPDARAPIIGFLNPDVIVSGPFIHTVKRNLDGSAVITGCRFGKPDRELAIWGVRDWVCGAALFVKRDWFTSNGGFDPRFVWSHEETDLIRTAESQGYTVRSITLPLEHQSPERDSPADEQYKRHHFAAAQRSYFRKWSP